MIPGVITIGISPTIHLGPITIAWHGLTVAIGIAMGSLATRRWLSERGFSPDPLYGLVGWLIFGGLVGGRLFYLLEHGGPLLSTTGFTFDGGVILAAVLLAWQVRRGNLGVRYLDGIAAGLPLGVAVGRIGDVINGEHYGPRSNFFLAVRNSNPRALTPDPRFAYQNGGLYEVLLASAIFAIVWPLRHRVDKTGDLTWLVLALFAAGRFLEFFLRSDSPALSLGLDNAQWTSLVLLVLSLGGWLVTRRRRVRGGSAAA